MGRIELPKDFVIALEAFVKVGIKPFDQAKWRQFLIARPQSAVFYWSQISELLVDGFRSYKTEEEALATLDLEIGGSMWAWNLVDKPYKCSVWNSDNYEYLFLGKTKSGGIAAMLYSLTGGCHVFEEAQRGE